MPVDRGGGTAPSAALPGRRRILSHFESRDPVMAKLIRSAGPFELGRNRNYFLVLCKSIVSQQISTRAAETIFGRFQDLFTGRRPTARRVLDLSGERLAAAGLSRQKIAYIRDLSAHFAEGGIRSRQLPWLDNETIIQTLTRVHGIGRWTAEMFLIFSLNRMNVLPVDDLGLRTAVRNIYGLAESPGARHLRTLGEAWHPLETVATWYAWRSLNPEIINY